MLLEWDTLGLRFRRGRCISIADLLICNRKNEELIMKDEADIAICNWRLLNLSFIQVNRYISYKQPLYQRCTRTKPKTLTYACIYFLNLSPGL